MSISFALDRFSYFLNRLRERLWVKPLCTCVFSVLVIVLAEHFDDHDLFQSLPEVTNASLETVLSILAGGMLAIATFAVGAMVSAYGSASSNATPRSFAAVIADDTSQNALSVFIGSFIFSVVGLFFLQNEVLGPVSRTLVFILSAVTYVVVIYTFVRWVDRIARLGRMGTTIQNVEKVCLKAIKRRSVHPHMDGCPPTSRDLETSKVILVTDIGYLQRIDMAALQKLAEEFDAQIQVQSLPGEYLGQGEVLCRIWSEKSEWSDAEVEKVQAAFQIDRRRIFDEDPRFGIVVLSEIASRALSPGVNDPGTAIDVMGSLHRLLAAWQDGCEKRKEGNPGFDRIEVPELSIEVLMEDAFASIARDGAGNIEVCSRLQEVLGSLSTLKDPGFYPAAKIQSEKSFARAKLVMNFDADLEALEKKRNQHFTQNCE
ncbi:DUF2254 domain-containing protein [Kiritimatiellaeota bacterium B1221]|nr:DUF2254 domain-containing protein [Kiritimatiellaeota bacterium B1221]